MPNGSAVAAVVFVLYYFSYFSAASVVEAVLFNFEAKQNFKGCLVYKGIL
jgi:hypothetical protein